MKKLHLRSINSTLSSAFIYAMTLSLAFNAPLYAQTIQINEQSTPLDHLKAMPRPKFKQGTTLLLPLGQSNCGLHADIHTELANYWGFGLEISDSKLDQVARANPGRYQLMVNQASIYRIYNNYRGDVVGLPVLPPNTWLRDKDGNIIFRGRNPVVSPAAPDEAFKIIGDYLGQRISKFETNAGQAIKVVLNEAESGLDNPAFLGGPNMAQFLGQDAAVLDDFNNSGFTGWYDYVSHNKARQERLIKEALFSHLQSRPVYSLFVTDQYGNERGRWGGWQNSMFRFEHFINSSFKPIVSDYTAPQMFYSANNSGWSGVHTGSLVRYDALTQALNNISGAIRLGQKFTYPWVSMGWLEGRISTPEEFMGMMKAYYTAGAIGSVGGYFVCNGPIWSALYKNTAIGTTTPTLIQQYAIQGHVHALFSHLEEYLRNGDLLPGPNLHPYTTSTQVLPAMEFPAEGETQQVPVGTRMVTIPTSRVLARKIRGEDRWLVIAWANVGDDRDVRVKIDDKLGIQTLRARKAGTMYIFKIVNGQIQRTLIDIDPMNPTNNLSS